MHFLWALNEPEIIRSEDIGGGRGIVSAPTIGPLLPANLPPGAARPAEACVAKCVAARGTRVKRFQYTRGPSSVRANPLTNDSIELTVNQLADTPATVVQKWGKLGFWGSEGLN